MSTKQVEEALSKAKRIEFFPSEGDNQPSIMGLIFDYDPIFKAIEAYKMIQEKFGNRDITTSFRLKNDKILISIISNSTSEVFNLNPMVEKGMNDFKKKLPRNTPFVFVIFQETEEGLLMMQTNDPFSPIVLSGYSAE